MSVEWSALFKRKRRSWTVCGTLIKKRLYRFTPEGQKELNLLLGPIRNEILVQGQLVRNLKENKTEGDLTNEVSKLKKLRRTEIHGP